MPMQSQNTFMLLLLLLLLIKFDVGSSESDSELYWKCSNTFSCGANITGIGYPFRGSTDPDYCGHRSLVLRCDERSNATTMEMAGLTYRVLEMDQEGSQTLRIAREETMSSACPTVMANTTLDYSVFDYAASCMNYTFFYGCRFEDPEAVHMTRVACAGDRGDAYVAPWVVPPMEACGASVVVSGALMAVDKPLDAAELGEALKHGFQIRWKMESQSCGECRASGGRCGYDLAANKTVCYCPHPPYVSNACAPSSPPISKGMNHSAYLLITLLITPSDPR